MEDRLCAIVGLYTDFGTDESGGKVEALVDQEAINDTYEGLLMLVMDTAEEQGLTDDARRTVNTVRKSINSALQGKSIMKVKLYNRDNHEESDTYELHDMVDETAGDHLYQSERTVGENGVMMKTLEMYVAQKVKGGFNA